MTGLTFYYYNISDYKYVSIGKCVLQLERELLVDGRTDLRVQKQVVLALQGFEEMEKTFEVIGGLLVESGGEICFEVVEEGMEVLREQAVDHLCVDVFANEFHVAADVPEFLADLEVLEPAFVTIDVQTHSLAFIIEDDVLVVAEGCLCLLVAPFSRLEGLHWLYLLELLCLEDILPAGFEKEIQGQVVGEFAEVELLLALVGQHFLA